MTIAVDFDGTIVEHRYPRIGREIPFATDTLKLLQGKRNFSTDTGIAMFYYSSVEINCYCHSFMLKNYRTKIRILLKKQSVLSLYNRQI